MTKYRAIVAYDGTDFLGFQKQAKARTVQGEIERALQHILGQPTAILAAGRTDAGVHATGQVIAFKADWPHGEDMLLRALNATLADDVAIQKLERCADDFHPRYDALSRVYEYVAYADVARRPLMRRYALRLERMPNVEHMNMAAQALIGTHDFAAFGRAPGKRSRATTVRRVLRAEWRVVGDGELRFIIEANAFLFHMVRRIVRALLLVGEGRWSVEQVRELLESRDAQRLKGLAPPQGLCLVKVTYQE